MPTAPEQGDSSYVLGSVTVPPKYYDTVVAAASHNGIRPELLAAALETESDFNETAVSPSGAIGIAQFMPKTAADEGVNPTDPTSSINGMAKLLSDYEKSFGSESLALAAYNAGPGAVQEAGNQVPNIAETQNYVNKILALAGGEQSSDATAQSGSTSDSSHPSGLSAIVHFFDNIADAAFWKRIGIGIIGAVIIWLGMRQLMPNVTKQVEQPIKQATEAAGVAAAL